MSDAPLKTRWLVPDYDLAALKVFFNDFDIRGVLGELLYARRPGSRAELSLFLNPSLDELGDPFALSDMQAAVERITLARDKNEHVRIIGDYDVDGISATAILARGLRRFGVENVTHALPDRLGDGYGLNIRLIDDAKTDGVDLIITVDNGIMAVDEAAHAKALGIDLIVTDHHALGETLPDAVAVINPKRDAADSPHADLCGSAVAFQLCSALNSGHDDLALVAVATVADVMPLTGQNRALTALGLQAMQRDLSPGLTALLRKAELNPKTVRAEDIAFQIAPRINASGRLGTGASALQLLLTDDQDEANYLANELDRVNEERKEVEREITENALEMIATEGYSERRTIVLASDQWHPGVIGIVASKLQHRFHKPVIMIGLDEDGVGRGSGRANDQFSLIDAFHSCSELFVKYGGHVNAAGMTILATNVTAFRDALEAWAATHETPTEPVREIAIDALLPFTEIDSELLGELDKLEPCGHANRAPLFATFGAKVAPGSLRILNGLHVSCSLQQDSRTFKAIGFNMADRIDTDAPPAKVDIAYVPKFNEWRGTTTIQLHLTDIKDSKRNDVAPRQV